MQTFSALNVRSHQRRKFSSLTFAYSDDHVLKLTGAQTFDSQQGNLTDAIAANWHRMLEAWDAVLAGHLHSAAS